ncbi:MAG: 6-bladed beta-propeller [Planctomycetota bacterium]
MLLLIGCEARSLASAGGTKIRDLRIIGGAGRGEGFFHEPRAVAALADGACVVIDRTGRIQRFDAQGATTQLWLLPEWANGQPVALALTPWETLIVADTHYHRLLEYTVDGRLLRRFADAERLGDGPGLEMARGVAIGADDVIYVTDYGEFDRVHRFARDGNYLGAFGQRGDGPGDLMRCEGIAITADHDVYVVDSGHHRVLRFSADGVFKSSFGAPGSGPGELLFPFGIATGSGDTLYVVDFRGNRVQRFDAAGRPLGGIGGPGREPGQFATPHGIAVRAHPAGDLVYVADTNNHRVQRFTWEP